MFDLPADPRSLRKERMFGSVPYETMDTRLKKKLFWAIFFSAGFMAFLLLRIEWRQFAVIAGRLHVTYLISAFCVFVLGNFIRTYRFLKLDHMNSSLLHWWNMNASYNFMTATLPGGAGEAATAYVLKRFLKFNLFSAVRILLLSRLLDMSAISAVFFFAAVNISPLTPYKETAVLLSGTLCLVSLITLIPSSERFLMRLLKKLPGRRGLKQKIHEKLSELLRISEEHHSNNLFGITLFQSVLMMMCGGVMMHFLLQSFGVDFTFVQSVYCYGVYAVFQIIPVQGIAGIGTQAAWWALALNAAGYDMPDAVALGFVFHGTFYLFISIMGMIAVISLLISRKYK